MATDTQVADSWMNAFPVQFRQLCLYVSAFFVGPGILWRHGKDEIGLLLFHEKVGANSYQDVCYLSLLCDLPHQKVFSRRLSLAPVKVSNASKFSNSLRQSCVSVTNADAGPICSCFSVFSPLEKANPSFAIDYSCKPDGPFFINIKWLGSVFDGFNNSMTPIVLIMFFTQTIYQFAKIVTFLNGARPFRQSAVGSPHMIAAFVRTIFSGSSSRRYEPSFTAWTYFSRFHDVRIA